MKRLGLIGVGGWGRRYIDTIGRRNDCRIAAVARASAAPIDIVPGAMPCASWQALVAQAAAGEIDAVIAATTPQHQAEVAVACATQAVPLLVEKPLGLSLADVERVRERFEAAPRKAPLVVNYVHLWSAAFVRLKHRVAEQGGAASVIAINSAGHNNGPLRAFSSLYDYGAHDLALALDLLGTDAQFRLREVACTRVGDGHELYDALFDLAGVPVHTRVGNGADHKARLFSVALRGEHTLVYDDMQPHPHKLVEDGVPIAIAAGGPLDAALIDFLEQLDQWQARSWSPQRARAALHLSERVNAILDELAARANVETA